MCSVDWLILNFKSSEKYTLIRCIGYSSAALRGGGARGAAAPGPAVLGARNWWGGKLVIGL